jgi:multidrug efflux pump subunit AcrA (membrane-fusion protein)
MITPASPPTPNGRRVPRTPGPGTASVAACAVLALATLLAGCRPATPRPPEAMPVQVEPARDATETGGQRGAAYLATVKGRNQITLSFRVPGIVDSIGPGDGEWEEGASVTNGQLLARLQQSDFLANQKSAEAQAQLDRVQFERAQRLLRDGAASQQEFDRAQAATEASQAALEGRRQELQDSRIVAPFAGTILEREVKAGHTVAAGAPIITLADLSEVEIEVGVPDRLVGLLSTGTRVPVAISGLGDEVFEGEVREVGVAAREGTRLFRVLVRVDNRRAAACAPAWRRRCSSTIRGADASGRSAGAVVGVGGAGGPAAGSVRGDQRRGAPAAGGDRAICCNSSILVTHGLVDRRAGGGGRERACLHDGARVVVPEEKSAP